MRVVVSGYAVGFRPQKNKSDKTYYILDLLQFGDKDNNSELQQLIIYDSQIASFLNDNFDDGKIKIISCKCNLIETTFNNRKSLMWVVLSVETFGSVTNLSNITIERNLLDKLKRYLLDSELDLTVNDFIEKLLKDQLGDSDEEVYSISNSSLEYS